jgi:uncharacterized protein (DUF1501 family)
MHTCLECRAEQEDLSRRTFLKRALGVAGATLVLNFFPAEFLRCSASAATNAGKTLVIVFQRGGNDGLNTVVPYSDPQYYVVRPSALSGAGNIGIPQPGTGDGSGIDLPGTGFAMHPTIQPFLDLYNNNTLAIVTQAGFAGSTQSHFTDQDTIERGLFQATDGWLNRCL